MIKGKATPDGPATLWFDELQAYACGRRLATRGLPRQLR